MTTILLTGATGGLGREAARRLTALGHDLWLGARDVDAGERLASELGARAVRLDVTDDASVTAAATTVGDAGGLDVLVNNAGILGRHATVPETTPDDLRAVYEVNVLGLVRVTNAFLPLLERSAAPVIVNVSSGMGSLDRTTDPGRVESSFAALAYPSSKSAVNMLTSQYAKALPRMRVNAADPGYTATAFNGFSGHQTVEEGTDAIVRLATLGPDGPTGAFFDRQGVVGW